MTTRIICGNQEFINVVQERRNVSDTRLGFFLYAKMYFSRIVSNCMFRKIIRSTPNRKNLFDRIIKSSLNYLFIRPTDVIIKNEYRELQLFLILENGDVRL